jgi:hypothetical protein
VTRLLLLTILLIAAITSTAFCEDKAKLYRDAMDHLGRGKAFFRRAMEDTSGGAPRANLCSQARKEYHEAMLKATRYNEITNGNGDDLMQQIQMNDYSAFKMAPDSVWSPPEIPEPASGGGARNATNRSGGTGSIIFVVVLVLGVGGVVGFVVANSKKKNARGAGRPSSGSSRRAQAVPEPPPARSSRSSRRAQAPPPKSSGSSSRRRRRR